MKRLYSHNDLRTVQNLMRALDAADINADLRAPSPGRAGGGVAWMDTWAEVWLTDTGQLEHALSVVRTHIKDTDEHEIEVEGAAWMCPSCETSVQPQFYVCWNCGYDREQNAS